MAQYRQSGFDRVLGRNGGSDHVSIGIRASNPSHKKSRTFHHRRFKDRKISIGALVPILSVAFVISVSVFLYLSGDKADGTVRKQAEENLKQFQEQNLASFLLSLVGELSSDDKPVDSVN